jgi:hypothetical protein
MNKERITIVALISCIWFTSCNAGTPPEITEMRRLCALDDGQKVYETVQANGYFDAMEDGKFAVATLVLGPGNDFTPYTYVEFCKDKPSSPYSVGIKLDKGCWRAEKVPRSSGRCNVDADNAMKRKVISPYPEFIKNQCIAVEKIDKPVSKFWSKGNTETWNYKGNENIQFIKFKHTIVDNHKNKIIAESANYLLIYRNRDIGQIGCTSPAITGKSYYGKDAPINLINQTIKPVK